MSDLISPEALSAAVDALGSIMLEMQRRRLMAQVRSDRAREILNSGRPALTDEQIGELAANAFEAGATELARVKHPGAAVFSCNPSEEPR